MVTVEDRDTFTITDKQKLVYDLSSGAISSDFEWPLTQISRARHYSTFNISDTTNIVLYVIAKD